MKQNPHSPSMRYTLIIIREVANPQAHWYPNKCFASSFIINPSLSTSNPSLI